MRTRTLSFALSLCLCSVAGAADVYLMSSGDFATDNAAASALSSRGHTVIIGVDCTAFDGSVSLDGYQTVYLQNNYNWTGGPMPDAGQLQLINWVNAGGRLVTSEWVTYYSYTGGRFAGLASILPGTQSFLYATNLSVTLTQMTADGAINAGLPASFTTPLTSYAGTEVYTTAKPGATTYYDTSNSDGSAGLVGWGVGAGWVYSFTSTCGPDQVGDANFGRLFANVMGAAGPVCGTADFDGDGDTATDADIEAFFGCLAGTCCATCWHLGADFDGDGDSATDADIEAFFRVLAGNPC